MRLSTGRLLTGKQERFVREYLVDFNGTQAAIRAGYSSDTTWSIASEPLRKSRVYSMIDYVRREEAKLFEISHLEKSGSQFTQ